VRRVAHAVRVGLRRRGLRYAGALLKNHVLPTAAYKTLLLMSPEWRDRVLSAPRRRPPSQPAGAAAGDGVPLSALPPGSISEAQIDELIAQLDVLHRQGIAGLRFGLPHVRVDRSSGRPCFSDLSRARQYRRGSLLFTHCRDLDRLALNARFGRTLWTEASARAALATMRSEILDAWVSDYAPIDFGLGLGIGSFAKTDSGTGRWECFNGPVVGPLVQGRRVLDLGCNNGSMPMMMLHSGASEVVGIERREPLARAARLVCEIASWRDLARYRFDIKCDDMRAFGRASDWGRFDVVTAFCSLYYLPPEEMIRIAEVARAMGAVLVLQGNTAIGGTATAEGLDEVARRAGYGRPEIVRFEGFSRPLVIARP
jgi:hypothetical protein